MTTYSQGDLATRMLKDLSIVASDETPSATDQDWAIETVSCEVAMLGSIGLPIWNGSDLAVPQEYLTILSRRCGLAVAPSFGLMSPAEAQIAMREAERYMTILASPRAATPLLMRSDDAMKRRTTFNFTTGQ